MNVPPVPGWMHSYFPLPTDGFVTAVEAAPLMGCSKVTAYRRLYDFLELNLVERRRVSGPHGRRAWGYRRTHFRIIYTEDVIAQFRRVSESH